MNPETARSKLQTAVRRGELVKPNVCELCEYDVTQPPETLIFGAVTSPRIVGHHWRGYDHPLEVWWICASCNRKLVGKHDGSVTKAQARELVGGKHRPLHDIFNSLFS